MTQRSVLGGGEGADNVVSSTTVHTSLSYPAEQFSALALGYVRTDNTIIVCSDKETPLSLPLPTFVKSYISHNP